MTDTKTMYETIAWKNGEDPQMPDDMRRFKTLPTALRYAEKIARSYALVEVNSLEVNRDDEMDLWGCTLEAHWKDGKRVWKIR